MTMSQDMDSQRNSTLAEVGDYLRLHANEADNLRYLRMQLHDPKGDPHARSNMQGHVTSSALAVDFVADKALLILHRASGLWIPAGGHFEPPSLSTDARSPIFESAARELREETGLQEFLPLFWPGQSRILPVDIETHNIPANARKGEAEHVHHDFLYVVEADSRLPLVHAAAEVEAARWFGLAELPRERRLESIAPKLKQLWSHYATASGVEK